MGVVDLDKSSSESGTQTGLRDPNIETVFINGLNFQAGAQVTFSPLAGSVNITFIQVNSSSEIEVDIILDTIANGLPAGTVFQVQVINPDGLQSNTANFTAN